MNPKTDALLLPACFLALYLILEAHDWGLLIAGPFLTRSKDENKAVLGLLKPGLDGNELWLLMGLFMLGAAFHHGPNDQVHLAYLILFAAAGLGAVVRLIACVARSAFSSDSMMKLLCAISIAGTVAIGLAGASLLDEMNSLSTPLGIVSAIWLLMAAFQMGCIYGAVKTVNPLAERFRAAYLVSSILSFVCFAALALLLWSRAGDSLGRYSGFFWTVLIAAVLLYVVSFFAVRTRHSKVGMTAAYLAGFFAAAAVLLCGTVLAPQLYGTDVAGMKTAVSDLPGSAILGVTAVWTLAAFIWRQIRKKERIFTRIIFKGGTPWENYSRRPTPLMKCWTRWA